MGLGKKVRRALGAPRRKFNKTRGLFFSTSYKKMVDLYAQFTEKSLQAARELDAGVIGSDSRKFFSGKLLNSFKRDKESRDAEFKAVVEEMLARWNKDAFLVEDAVWLREQFVPYLEECKQRDIQALAEIYRVDKGLPTDF